jgi:hypothetical protein
MATATLEYLTVNDAAQIVGLSGDGIRQAAEDGRLRVAATTPTGVRLFLREDVVRFQKDRAKARRIA